jgi:hypothetical protein
MWKNDWLVLSSLRAEFPFPARPYPGKVAGMGGDRTDGGLEHGARSNAGARGVVKSPVVKRSIVLDGHKTSVSLEDAFWKCER